MAKKNVRSRAANSSADDLESRPPENDLNMDLTANKGTRGRRRPADVDETWPNASVDQSKTHQTSPAESSDSSSDENRGDSRRRPRRDDPNRENERTPARADDSNDSFANPSENPNSIRSSDSSANGAHAAQSPAVSETTDSQRRNFRGPRNDGGNDNRNDSRRRSRRRRGGGGGGSGGAGVSGPNPTGSPNTGRAPQDNQRGGSRRSRRGRGRSQGQGSQNQDRSYAPDRSFGQDRNFTQDRSFGQDRNQSRNQNRNSEPFELDDTELFEGYGMLEVHPNGYGFLRHPNNSYSREKTDPFVPGTMIEKFGLRPGVMLRGMIQPGKRQQGPRLRELFDVDGIAPEEYINVKNFDDLTPINPVYWYRLESGPTPVTTRVMDLLTPLGKGQRALIVSPPRSGKTVMLQHIAHGVAENHPKTKLIVLLIDERPEEVTDMKRNVRGEVIASSLDEDIESHVRLSQIVIARCKRLAEMGQDVFLLMDSITRLARAFNKWVGNTGRTMSGGVDIKAMDIPKKLFSSARAFEEGGSLTIVGTALIDTGSRMDELIFQEFKGTGNMEMVLDRKLADRRIWPAIDITQSGTRREELLLHPDTLHAVTMLRRTLTSMNHVEAMEQLTKQLSRFKTNQEFINLISGKMGEL